MADNTGPQGPQDADGQAVGSLRGSSSHVDNRSFKSKKPNYNQIHAQPLPLTVYPLPTLIPHNPFSLLHIAFVYFRQLLWTPSSVPDPIYQGLFSSETRSVHVTDPTSVRALWEGGFFGKGSLSRSEPSWLDREKRKRGLLAEHTSEEWTRKRREERRRFKMERARLEQEAIQKTLQQEQNGDLELGEVPKAPINISAQDVMEAVASEKLARLQTTTSRNQQASTSAGAITTAGQGETQISSLTADVEEDLKNEEHLQLDLEEAFFLTFALGVLSITDPGTKEPISLQSILPLFLSHSSFPPTPVDPTASVDPSNPFLVSYAAYHHFRSLGWVVRSGIKFSVDLLLYLRGPAFSHAEFAVNVVPAYSHPYWREQGRDKCGKKPWHWLHMVNRVQSQVRKTLVLCYVEVPPPVEWEVVGEADVQRLLKRYKVREFVIRRWIPARNRD